QLIEQLNQTRRRQPLSQHPGHDGVVGVKMRAPKIVRNLIQEPRLIRHQLRLERRSTFKCTIGQNSRTKTMDSEDGGFIKTLQREFQSALELFPVANSGDDLLDEGQTLLRLRVRDCFSNATTQFRRR